MDGDPAVEPELDSFSRVLPLPYRVALIIVLGMENTFSTASPSLEHANMTQAYGHGALTSITSL